MKRWLAMLLVATLVTAAFTGCGKKEKDSDKDMNPEPTMTTEEANKAIHEGNQFDITFEGYEEAGGTIISTLVNGEEHEFGGFGYIAAEGMKISDVLIAYEVTDLEPVHASGDVFEGWMEYEIVQHEEDGYTTEEYVRVSDDMISTEEIFARTMPDHQVMYVAKWESIPMDDYFEAEEVDPEAFNEDFSFTLSSNGGVMTFEAEEPYESDMYTYYWKPGETLGATMENGLDDPLGKVTKEGKTFTGWTVYVGDNIEWPLEMVEEKGSICFEISEYWYIQLYNCKVYGENVSTEELKNITCENNFYYAVANWE